MLDLVKKFRKKVLIKNVKHTECFDHQDHHQSVLNS